MTRKRTLTIEDRNALERHAIERGHVRGYDKPRGSQHVAFVEGFMEGAQLTPDERGQAIARFDRRIGVEPKPRTRRAVVPQDTAPPTNGVEAAMETTKRTRRTRNSELPLNVQ